MRFHLGSVLALTLTLSFVAEGATTPQWTVENIAPSSAGNRKVALRVTSDGRVHMAFTGSVDAALKTAVLEYAVRNTNGQWTRTIVDDDKKKTGWFPSMAIDAENGIHITYAAPWPKARLHY